MFSQSEWQVMVFTTRFLQSVLGQWGRLHGICACMWKKIGKKEKEITYFPTCYILSLSSVVLFHLISEYEYFKQWFMTNRIQKFNCVTCSDYIHILYINISQNPEFQNVEGIWIYIYWSSLAVL